MSANPNACNACGKVGCDLVTCECSHCTEHKGRVNPTRYCNNDGRCQEANKSEHEREVTLVGAFLNLLLDAKKRSWEAEGKDACRLHDGDEDLFKTPPPRDECKICCLPLPLEGHKWYYQSCCGQVICNGCIVQVHSQSEECPCPYCRAPACESNLSSDSVERLKKRVDAGDSEAFGYLGNAYDSGWYGLEKDAEKARELWTEGANRGSPYCHYTLGAEYAHKEDDADARQKARYHLGVAAMAGHVTARYSLGLMELKEASRTMLKEARIVNGAPLRRAVKHWMIAASAGSNRAWTSSKEATQAISRTIFPRTSWRLLCVLTRTLPMQ